MAKLIIDRKQHFDKNYLEWYHKTHHAFFELLKEKPRIWELKNLCISVSKPDYQVTIIQREEAQEGNLVFRLPDNFSDEGIEETVAWVAYILTRWQEHSKVNNK